MRVIRKIREMQRLAGGWKRRGVKVAFVPTMGYLHGGHMSLVQRARKFAGRSGKVVVSIYVNPTQFAPSEDFSRYPRDFKRDSQLCREAGVDAIFVPPDAEMYPPGEYSTYVLEEQLSKRMEGTSRPTHFRGVTTIVAKLFNIVQPTHAIFGSKDFQQAVVIKRMAANLNFPLRIDIAPTFREKDGLAMSSRNKYLAGALRSHATVLWQAIQMTHHLLRRTKKPIKPAVLRREINLLINSVPSARVDYVEFFDPGTLTPARAVHPGVQIALAVFIGKTRLIDNALL